VEVAEAVAVDLGLVGLGIQVPVPDIVVGSGAAFWGGGKGLAPADVLLAVEVVSPGSTGRDRIFKPGLFAKAGIPAFWRVELDGPGIPLVVVHALHGDAYQEVSTVRASESATSTCRTSWNYAQPAGPSPRRGECPGIWSGLRRRWRCGCQPLSGCGGISWDDGLGQASEGCRGG
jgi:hypothetical protein